LSNHIVFQPGLAGTITLTQGKFVISKALEVDAPGANLLTVSGNHQSGVFDITAPAGQAVFLSGLTIADGTGAGDWFGFISGGGLFNDSATVTLNHTTFSGNTVPFRGIGGAIFNFHGTMTLNSCTISDNHADDNGSAGAFLSATGAAMTLNNSTISGNTTYQGFSTIAGGTLMFNHCLIAGNKGNIGAGGTLTITDSTLTGNTSVNDGGALS